MIHNKLNKPLFVLLLLIGVLIACTSERNHIENIESTESTVTFSLELPGSSFSATRSLTDDEENNVQTIDVLVFNSNSSDHQASTFVHSRRGKILSTTTTEKTFEIVLPKGTFDLVVIANARQNIIDQAFQKDETRAEVMGKLEHSLAEGVKWTSTEIPMWGFKDGVTVVDNTNSTGIQGIKMVRMLAKIEVELSGEAAGAGNSNFAINSVHLYNYNTAGSIAPQLPSGWNAGSNEAINPNIPTSAEKKRGPLAYTSADDISSPKEYFTKDKVLNTIYTFEAQKGSTANRLENTCLVIGGNFRDSADNTHFYRVDFIQDNDADPYMHVLRNHRYKFVINKITGEGFHTPDEAFEAGPVNIEAEVLAWNEGNANDLVWDGQHYLSVNQGNFELSSAQYAETDLDNVLEIETNWKDGWEITQITDLQDVELPADNQWITVAEANKSGPKEVKAEFPLLIEKNTTGETRQALLHIQAGKLTYKVSITQFNDEKTALWVEDEDGIPVDMIDFISKIGDPVESRKYTVRWSPKSADVKLSLAAAGSQDLIEWEGNLKPDNPTSITNELGAQEFIVKPTPLTSFDGETDFGIRYTEVKYKMIVNEREFNKTLLLGQFTENLHIDIDTHYLLDGKTYQMTVYANTAWKLVAKRNSNKVGKRVISKLDGKDLAAVTDTEIELARGEFNLPQGTSFDFTTVKDFGGGMMPEVHIGDFHLELVALDDPTLNDTKSTLCGSAIIQEELSNCYILDPTTGFGILIPVKRANGYRTMNSTSRPDWTYGDQITKNMDFGAKLVWSDSPGTDNKGIADDAGISLIEQVKKGENGYIIVMPGSHKKEGNALVAATQNSGGSGTILWNWHVWLTPAFTVNGEVNIRGGHFNTGQGLPGYHNASNLWMDRNLGALRNGYKSGTTQLETDENDLLKAHGIYFQWGHPVPIPSVERFDEGCPTGDIYRDNLQPVWDALGQKVNFTEVQGHVNGDIRIAIKNSTVKYYNSVSKHWYHSGPEKNKCDLWYNNGKTIYDPCPLGWRIPIVETETSWNSSLSEKHWGNEFNLYAKVEEIGLSYRNKGYVLSYGPNIYRGGYYPMSGNRRLGLKFYFSSITIDLPINHIENDSEESSIPRYLNIVTSVKNFNATFTPLSKKQQFSSTNVRCVREK